MCIVMLQSGLYGGGDPEEQRAVCLLFPYIYSPVFSWERSIYQTGWISLMQLFVSTFLVILDP